MGDLDHSFKAGYMRRLRNNEFPLLIIEVLSKSNEVEVDEPYLDTVINRVKRHERDLEKIGNETFFHPFTEVLRKEAILRRDNLVTLRMTVEAARRSIDSERAEAAEEVYLLLRPELRHLTYPGIRSQTMLVKRLAAKISESPSLSDSLEKIDCGDLFNLIVEETDTIFEMENIRTRDVARMKREVKAKREAAYKDFKHLLRTFETMASVPGPNQSVMALLCKDVGRVIDEYRARLSSRITRKRTAASAAEDENNDNSNPNEEEGGIKPKGDEELPINDDE